MQPHSHFAVFEKEIFIHQPSNQQKMRIPMIIFLMTILAISTAFSQKGNYLKLSSKITTETKDITNFNQLEVGEDFEVIIHFSNTEESVKIEANENLHPYIEVEQIGKKLKIGTKSYSTRNYGRKGGARERLIAHITAKELVSIEGEEDVVIELEDKLLTENLTIRLDEDCTLSGEVDVRSMNVELREDSALDLDGQVGQLDLEAKEDSSMKGYDLEVGDLTADLRSDSQAKLTVNGTISLRASGDSSFYYKGDAEIVKQRLSGDASIKSW